MALTAAQRSANYRRRKKESGIKPTKRAHFSIEGKALEQLDRISKAFNLSRTEVTQQLLTAELKGRMSQLDELVTAVEKLKDGHEKNESIKTAIQIKWEYTLLIFGGEIDAAKQLLHVYTEDLKNET